MKRYLLAIVLLLPFILQAKVAVEKPRSKQPTAFAIVVDQATYDKTAPQIHAYRDVLEADGLSTYILRDNWQTPEQVREQLIALMRKTAKRSPLEGVVFVGDIPIAMVRNAQHLTTAFKMDEDNFPMIQSSVPSDRYYDCPDLQFELIARDTTDRLLSYFNLACDSPQHPGLISLYDHWVLHERSLLFTIKVPDPLASVSDLHVGNVQSAVV